jgi:alpha-galactosidase
VLAVWLTLPASAGALGNGLALTPPMGWNPWNHFGCAIDEPLVLDTAHALVASGMKASGYRYVVLDDCWMARSREGNAALEPDPQKFQHGIAALARQLHAMGFGFGLYLSVGTLTCQRYPGSYGHLAQDVSAAARWGVDYLKVDWCYPARGERPRQTFNAVQHVVARSGRRLLLSLSGQGFDTAWSWGERSGNLWRTTRDTANDWSSLMLIVDADVGLGRFAHPGAWNDPDMLEVGNGALTGTEQISQMSLWSMLAAPLIAGNDLRQMSAATRVTLTNREVIAIDQDRMGRQGARVRAKHGHEVWARRLAGGDSAIVLLNRTKRAARVRARLQDLPDVRHAPRYVVRDLWAHATHRSGGGLDVTLQPHAVAMYRVHPLKPHKRHHGRRHH